MDSTKINRQNRVREVLGKIYDQEPPYFREYLKRLREDPSSRVFVPLVEAYRRLGRLEEAIQIGQNGVQYHPDLMSGRVALAKCYLDKKLFMDAKEQLDYVVQRAPDNLLAHRLLGETHLILGNRSLSIHHFKMASLLSPSDVQLQSKLYQLESTVHEQHSHSNEEVEEIHLQEEQREVLREPTIPEAEEPEYAAEPARHEEFQSFQEQLQHEVRTEDLTEKWETFEDDDWLVEENVNPVDELLGASEKTLEDGFKVEHISEVFQEEPAQKKGEITTETLGDLYYAQQLYEKSLKVFERLYGQNPRAELLRKINLCRNQMGVDKETIVRKRQIQVLQDLLTQVKHHMDE